MTAAARRWTIAGSLVELRGVVTVVRILVSVLLAVVAGACAAPTPVTPTVAVSASPSVAVSAPTDPASPTSAPNRPMPPPGAPAIAEPFWLLAGGTGVNTVTAADGTVVTEHSDTYRVIEGGSLEGTILINGDWVGVLSRSIADGEAIAGLNPIEQQYGVQLDAKTPDPAVLPAKSPNPYWVRSTEQRGGRTVYVRVPSETAAAEGIDLASEAFWWDADGEHWYQLSVNAGADFDAVLGALLAP